MGLTAFCAALFGIYALDACWSSASGDSEEHKALLLVVALLTTALSWSLVHLLFALEYAKLFYVDPNGLEDGPPPGGLDFPGGHPARVLGFSCTSRSSSAWPDQTADVDISARQMRRIALLHGLIAFLFNTVILAATINVAAGLG